MDYILENEHCKVAFKSKGAELCSFVKKDTGVEYIWQADPAYWGRHAPVLFPIVGRLKNDTMTFGGKSYQMTQHGFARDMDFDCVEETNNQLIFNLKDSKASKEKYPFSFEFRIIYQLDTLKLTVNYEVINKAYDTIYFSVGAHPAFNCPLNPEESISDYYLEFEKEEEASSPLIDGGLISSEKQSVPLEYELLPLSHQLFENDALIWEKPQSSYVTLRNKKFEKGGVKVTFDGMPFLGIWTKKDAPFLCIEPWDGIADGVEHDGEIENKRGIISLREGNTYKNGYGLEVF